MVDTGEMEMYLNDKSCREGDECEILEEGLIETKEDSQNKRTYKVLNLPVKVNNRQLIYSPNSDARAVLQENYGTDTKKWIGKKFKVKFYPKTAFGVTKQAILPKIG